MNNKQNNRFRCGVLDNYKVCDEEQMTASTNIEVIKDDATTIEPTDELIFVRKNCNTSRVYKGSWNDLDPKTALLILQKSILVMPKKDPEDGRSLWNNNGYLCVASDPVADAFS